MNDPQTFHLELTRFIAAPPERVFDAFVTESLLSQWHCPRGMTVQAARSDPREGGRWQLEMRSREGTGFAVGGEYRSVQRPGRLVYTWEWQASAAMPGLSTLIEIDFVARQQGERAGTELRMRHSGFPDAGARDSHTQGWNSTLNRLIDLVDARGTAATLTLLGDPRSSYVRTVRMALAEKGLAYTLAPCAPHSPEILAVHPFGKIPALTDGPIALWETSAILRYLDEAFAGPSLTPGTVIGRTRCEQWVSAINAYCYDTMVRRAILPMIRAQGSGRAPDRTAIDAALAEVPGQLATLEAAYAATGTGYLVGDAPTHADLFLAPILATLEMLPEAKAMMGDHPAVQRGIATIRSRPSFAAAHAPAA